MSDCIVTAAQHAERMPMNGSVAPDEKAACHPGVERRKRPTCRALVAVTAFGLAVSSCATVIEGKSQQVSVNTNPPGAECGFYREEGARIATIPSTPGSALIEKTKKDIWIVCVRPGYQQATYRNHSGVAGAAFVNVIGGVLTLGISTAVGVAIDSANGSDNKYDGTVNISMVASSADGPDGPSKLPQTFDPAKIAPAELQQAAPAPVEIPTAAAARDRRAVPAAVPVAAVPPRPAGTLPAAGVWECGINNTGSRSNPYFRLHFVVAADHSMVVTNYANAPATILKNDPLTFTAVNPRGARLTTFSWKTDNTMTITGPGLNNPDGTFHNEGTCLKT